MNDTQLIATEKSTKQGQTSPGEAVVRVRNLVKNYGPVQALKGIDLEVYAGEMFALLGPNGAGKTTLFSILSTLRSATDGEAIVLGYDTHKDQEAIRREIGIVFQEPALDQRLSARDNLRLMALFYGIRWADAKARTEEIIDVLGIREFMDRPPRKLSGGQKRKLELARSLVSNPQLLFLDEATLGLDVDARRSFWRAVQHLTSEGRTVFFTTHYMEEAEVADRIALISEGYIIALGSPRELRNRIGGGLIRLRTHSNQESFAWLKSNGYSVESGEQELLVVSEDPAATLPELLDKLPEKVIRAEIREPSLEDVFLTLTGKGLEGNGQNTDGATGNGNPWRRRQ